MMDKSSLIVHIYGIDKSQLELYLFAKIRAN